MVGRGLCDTELCDQCIYRFRLTKNQFCPLGHVEDSKIDDITLTVLETVGLLKLLGEVKVFSLSKDWEEI